MTTLDLSRTRPAPAARITLALPRLSQLWVLLTLVGTFIGPASSPLGLSDVWSTLLSGKWMVQNHALLGVDPFTSAPQALPQIDGQWLAQLAYYGVYLLGGNALVICVSALAASLAYGLVLWAGVVTSHRLRLTCAALAVGYLLGFTNLTARPQTLVYWIFGAFVLVVALARERARLKLLWLLPPLTAIWANSHGSFFLGVAYLGCVGLGDAIAARRPRAGQPYLLAALGCAAAACLTPDGPGSLAYVLNLSTNPVIRQLVTEWAPTTISQQEGVLFFGSAVLVAGLAYLSEKRLSLAETFILLVFGWLAVSSLRSVAWWGLAIVPILARLASGIRLPARRQAAAPRREVPLLNATLLAIILLLLGASLPWFKTINPVLPTEKRTYLDAELPQGVAAYLAHTPYPGLLLTHQIWGGYVEWVGWPNARPFVDGRIELHPPQVWYDYLDATFPSARWQALLDRYGIGTLALDREADRDLIAEASQSPSWIETYQDDQAVVFRRVSAPAP